MIRSGRRTHHRARQPRRQEWMTMTINPLLFIIKFLFLFRSYTNKTLTRLNENVRILPESSSRGANGSKRCRKKKGRVSQGAFATVSYVGQGERSQNLGTCMTSASTSRNISKENMLPIFVIFPWNDPCHVLSTSGGGAKFSFPFFSFLTFSCRVCVDSLRADGQHHE